MLSNLRLDISKSSLRYHKSQTGCKMGGLRVYAQEETLKTQLMSFTFILESIETTLWRLHENSTTGRREISKNHSLNVWKEQKEGQ